MASGFSLGKLARSLLRVTAWLIVFFLLLVALVFLLMETSWGNNQLRSVAESWLRKKLNTELSIGQLQLHGLHGISLQDVMLRDQQKDTLLALDSLSVSFECCAV